MSTEDSLTSKEKIKKATQLLNEVHAQELSEDEFKEAKSGVNLLLMADGTNDIQLSPLGEQERLDLINPRNLLNVTFFCQIFLAIR